MPIPRPADDADLVEIDLDSLLGAIRRQAHTPSPRNEQIRDRVVDLLTDQLADPRDAEVLDRFVERCAAVAAARLDPFDGYLEAPASIARLHQAHAADLRDLAGDLHDRADELLRDAVVARWPGVEDVSVMAPRDDVHVPAPRTVWDDLEDLERALDR